MSARRHLFAAMSVLALGVPGAGRAEIVYVAVGGSYAFAGAPRAGDPARIASRLRRTGQAVRLVDLTVDGATARHVREAQLPRAIALKPHLVTVALGPADAADGVRLASFARDLHIVTDLLRRAGATVAISTLPPAERIRDVPSPAFQRRVEAFNWAIRRDAHRNGLRLADLGGAVSAVEASWEDAMFAAIGNSPPRRRSAPPGRVVEPAPQLGAAVVSPGFRGMLLVRSLRNPSRGQPA